MTFRGTTTYYDNECVFCAKWVRIMHRALLLPDDRIFPARADAQIWREVLEKNSWVVVDHFGAHRYGFDAMTALVAASPVLFFCAPLMRIPSIANLGERYYRRVARRRSWL
jgi:predicted DCC family thiol-disulfide oxidoreductase YuxK